MTSDVVDQDVDSSVPLDRLAHEPVGSAGLD